MNPDSTRKAIRRSILKQEGARRVDVMLSTKALADLATVRERTGFDTAKAIAWALAYAETAGRLASMSPTFLAEPSQPLTTSPL